MIKNIQKEKLTNVLTLKAVFKGDELPKNLEQKKSAVTNYFSDDLAYVYLDEKSKLDFKTVNDFAKKIALSSTVETQIDLDTFVTEQLSISEVVRAFVGGINFVRAELWNAKTNKKDEEVKLHLVSLANESEYSAELNKTLVLSEYLNFTRELQITPPNICNSEWMADKVFEKLSQNKNLKVTVLNKKQIEEQKMGLLLSVNRGSVYEPRVVVVEYNGNPESNEKTVYVGKGITFDSGGYSLKPGRSMLGMKFDMSGAAIVGNALGAIAELQPKVNAAAVLCITDNRVNGDASLPDSVWTSMNGKSVEINNTDAEGRLVMADGLTYAVRNLKATRLVDVATLTGAIVVALGSTYTGVWTTTEQAWDELSKAAQQQNELVWRMPLDEEFAREIRNSHVADLKNTDLSGAGAGSSSAAMFLKEFTENVEYIHLDIAGTADIGGKPFAPMMKTLVQLALNKSN